MLKTAEAEDFSEGSSDEDNEYYFDNSDLEEVNSRISSGQDPEANLSPEKKEALRKFREEDLSSFKKNTGNSNSEGEGNLHTTSIQPFKTKGDGNCFFHAVFGTRDNSSKMYETGKAQDMRKEWHGFLSQFKSLKDTKMPQALKEYFLVNVFEAFIREGLSTELMSVLNSAFKKSDAVKIAHEKAKEGTVEDQESFFSMSELYEAYLEKITDQGYYVSTEEVKILASLADITIHMYVSNPGKKTACEQVFTPDPEIIVEGYIRDWELWGKSREVGVFHQNAHYSRLPDSILGLSQCDIVTPGKTRFPFKRIENTPQENEQRGASHSEGSEGVIKTLQNEGLGYGRQEGDALHDGLDARAKDKELGNIIAIGEKVVNVEDSLDKGCNVNDINGDRWTFLHWAVLSSNFEAVKFLVDKGADISAKSCDGDTPLDIAKYLIKRCTKIQESNYNGWDDGLDLVTDYTKVKNLECNKGTMPTGNDLKKIIDEIKQLAQNVEEFLENKQAQYNESVFKAAKNLNFQEIAILLKKGADPHAMGNDDTFRNVLSCVVEDCNRIRDLNFHPQLDDYPVIVNDYIKARSSGYSENTMPIGNDLKVIIDEIEQDVQEFLKKSKVECNNSVVSEDLPDDTLHDKYQRSADSQSKGRARSSPKGSGGEIENLQHDASPIPSNGMEHAASDGFQPSGESEVENNEEGENICNVGNDFQPYVSRDSSTDSEMSSKIGDSIKQELEKGGYSIGKLDISIKVKDDVKAAIDLKRKKPTGGGNHHTLAVAIFIRCVKEFFAKSSSYDAADSLFSLFSRKLFSVPLCIKQNDKYDIYAQQLLKKLKKLEGEQLKSCLSDEFIPFTYFIWDKRIASMYYQHSTQEQFGEEGGKVTSFLESFSKLLSNSTIESDGFKSGIEDLQGKFFSTIDLPTYILQVPEGLLGEKELENLQRSFTERLTAIKEYISGVVEGDLYVQVSGFSISNEVKGELYNALLLSSTDRDEKLKQNQEEWFKKLEAEQSFKKVKPTLENAKKLGDCLSTIIGLYAEESDTKIGLESLKEDLNDTIEVLKGISGGNSYDIDKVAKKDLKYIIRDARKLFLAVFDIIKFGKSFNYETQEEESQRRIAFLWGKEYFQDEPVNPTTEVGDKQWLNGMFKRESFVGKLINCKNLNDTGERYSKEKREVKSVDAMWT